MSQHPSRHALITGFGPFPGVPRNPSGLLATRIARDPRWRRLGWRIKGRAFPTDYARVAAEIADLAEKPPRFVLMLGVAARSKALRVEMVARNRSSLTARDVSGWRVKRRALEAGAAASRPGRHAGPALVQALRDGGVKAGISRDAGRYVCNASYWWMLGAMQRSTRVVFVHIPLPGMPGRRKRDSRKRDTRPDMAAMQRALSRLVLSELGRPA